MNSLKNAPEAEATYNVILTASGDRKICVIKAIRALTDEGLKECLWLMDEAPSLILEDISREEADRARTTLEAEGATAEARPSTLEIPSGYTRLPKKPKRNKYDVILIAAGDNEIPVIKTVHTIRNRFWRFQESMQLVYTAPNPIQEGVSRNEAENIRATLETLGATVEVRPSSLQTEPPPIQESPAIYTVILTSAGNRKGMVARALRALTGASMSDTYNNWLATTPSILDQTVTQEDAEKIKAALETEGAEVEIQLLFPPSA